MTELQKKLAILRAYNRGVQERDPRLSEEARDRRYESEIVAESISSDEDLASQIQQESIVLRRERPVLAIKENVTQLVFIDPIDSEAWGERLKSAQSVLDAAVPAVGRIELQGGRLSWVGTGWLVADNIIVTNRHVAREFAERRGAGFDFKMGVASKMSADIDFLEEIDNPRQLVFRLVRPLHIEEPTGPDVAFFEVAMVSGESRLAQPIPLAAKITGQGHVATIGYPAYDSRIPEADLMERIYGKVYNKKRLAPGGVTRMDATRLWHDCTTLGGNSGSVVYDLDQGAAVGLHFSGSFLVTNYAVRADVVGKLLADVKAGRTPRSEGRAGGPPRVPSAGSLQVSASPSGGGGHSARGHSASVSIPLTVTVSIDVGCGSLPATRRPGRDSYSAGAGDTDDKTPIVEGIAEDYRDREGYAADFLGEEFQVDLPQVSRDAADVLGFEVDGQPETELRYEHFSVVMSRSRRMCFFSACNINGKTSRKTSRGAWRLDPRIPKEQQIIKECYGNPPKFSRGHMTRREDPAWGGEQTSQRGSDDSMHVTNATPQMQAFNAPIWLELEDYALQNARQDDMRISVFTGPYFSKKDTDRYGVLIPTAFWKIIAFIHDETGELCATGYEMSQDSTLPEEEFVFGALDSQYLNVATQVPIRSIEARSGIHFGRLTLVDALANGEEGVAFGGESRPLLSLEQIRFFR